MHTMSTIVGIHATGAKPHILANPSIVFHLFVTVPCIKSFRAAVPDSLFLPLNSNNASHHSHLYNKFALLLSLHTTCCGLDCDSFDMNFMITALEMYSRLTQLCIGVMKTYGDEENR